MNCGLGVLLSRFELKYHYTRVQTRLILVLFEVELERVRNIKLEANSRVVIKFELDLIELENIASVFELELFEFKFDFLLRHEPIIIIS